MKVVIPLTDDERSDFLAVLQETQILPELRERLELSSEEHVRMELDQLEALVNQFYRRYRDVSTDSADLKAKMMHFYRDFSVQAHGHRQVESME